MGGAIKRRGRGLSDVQTDRALFFAPLFLAHRALVPQAHDIAVGVDKLGAVTPEILLRSMVEGDAARRPLGEDRVDVVDLEPQRGAVRGGAGFSCRKIAKPSPSCSDTVRLAAISNSTFRPSVETYQSRERSRLLTGRLRWSNFITTRSAL